MYGPRLASDDRSGWTFALVTEPWANPTASLTDTGPKDNALLHRD